MMMTTQQILQLTERGDRENYAEISGWEERDAGIKEMWAIGQADRWGAGWGGAEWAAGGAEERDWGAEKWVAGIKVVGMMGSGEG